MKLFGRWDWAVSSQNRATFSITENGSHSIDGGTICPINCQHAAGDGYAAQFSDVHMFGSNTVNEFRWGYVRGATGLRLAARGWDICRKSAGPTLTRTFFRTSLSTERAVTEA